MRSSARGLQFRLERAGLGIQPHDAKMRVRHNSHTKTTNSQFAGVAAVVQEWQGTGGVLQAVDDVILALQLALLDPLGKLLLRLSVPVDVVETVDRVSWRCVDSMASRIRTQ